MAIKKRPMSPDGKDLERRKSRRFPVVVPIEVTWRGADGTVVKEDAVARHVNANGGFLKMINYPDLGSRVTLANFFSAQVAEARVLAAPHAREGVANGIIIELIVPNESFWGVDLQVKKTSIELENLEKALQCEEIDLRLLEEYRDAVDYIRTAAEAVRNLRKCQLQGQNDAEVLSALTSDRISRTIKLCSKVIADTEAGRVKRQSKDTAELCRTIEHLHDQLRQAVTPPSVDSSSRGVQMEEPTFQRSRR